MLQVLDANGKLAWNKQVKAQADNVASVKFNADASKPVSRAAWNAVLEGYDALVEYVKIWDTPQYENAVDDNNIEQLPLIDIAFDSIPPNADVYVDGMFRGNTPTVIPLPTKDAHSRLSRSFIRKRNDYSLPAFQGYQKFSWEANWCPSADRQALRLLILLYAHSASWPNKEPVQ